MDGKNLQLRVRGPPQKEEDMKEKNAVLSSGKPYCHAVARLKELIASDCLLYSAEEPFTVASLHSNLLPRSISTIINYPQLVGKG
jgi:hypothetical protein